MKAYSDIKDYFLTQFDHIDSQVEQMKDILNSKNLTEKHSVKLIESKTALLHQIITEFIQEGIGALLAYLPFDVAMHTLVDFQTVIGQDSKHARKSSSQMDNNLKRLES